MKDPQTLSHLSPTPEDRHRSFFSQFLTCSGEERLNQAVDIIPCLLGAAPQFLLMEEGSDTLNLSPFSPFDHKLKQNSLEGLDLGREVDQSSPACLGLCSLGWGWGCEYSIRLSEQHTQGLNGETRPTSQESGCGSSCMLYTVLGLDQDFVSPEPNFSLCRILFIAG